MEDIMTYRPVNNTPALQKVKQMEVADQHRMLEKFRDNWAKKEEGFRNIQGIIEAIKDKQVKFKHESQVPQ